MTWANQIRILGQNFERLGQVIGSGFIAWLRPLVVTINSYMDSIIAAVQRVVNALGQIFGWKMIVDTTGAVVDDVEGIADAYDDATGAAKKFKQQLLGIDELNNLTTKDGGSGSADSAGIGGGGVNIISPGGIEFKPIESDIKDLYSLGKKLSDGLANLLPDSWDEIYKKARNFGTGLADFLNGLIQPETFKKVGQSLAGALNTISEAIFSFFLEANWKQYGDAFLKGLEGFFEEFNVPVNVASLAIIVGAITVKNVAKWVFSGGALKALGTALSGALTKILPDLSLGGISTFLGGISTGSLIAGGALAALVAGLGITYATNEKVRDSFKESSEVFLKSLTPALEFISNTLLPNLWVGFQGLLGILQPIGDFLSTVFVSIWNDMISPALKNIGEDIIPPLINALENLWTGVIVPLADILGGLFGPTIKIVAEIMKDLWINVVVPLAQGLGSILSSAIQLVIGLLNDVIVTLTPVIKIIDVLWNASLKPLAEWLVDTLKPVVDTVFTFIGNLISGLFKSLSGLINFITGVFYGDWSRAWNGIADVFKGIFNGLISVFETVINLIIDGLNGLGGLWNWATSGLSEIIGKDISIPKVEHIVLNKFEYGGFPDQGSLFLAGETYGQSEWVGNINGRTGVTSGAEITGIADAIYSTSAQEMELLRQQNNYLVGILNKEFGISQTQIGKASRGYAKEYYDRTGRQAYQF